MTLGKAIDTTCHVVCITFNLLTFNPSLEGGERVFLYKVCLEKGLEKDSGKCWWCGFFFVPL